MTWQTNTSASLLDLAAEISRAEAEESSLQTQITGITSGGSIAGKADKDALFAGVPVAAPVSSAVTVALNTLTPADATAGAFTVTLPAPAKVGQVIGVEKVDASANAVTVAGTIRGVVATVALQIAHESVLLVAESTTSWRPYAANKPIAAPGDVPGLTAALAGKQATLTAPGDVPGLTTALTAKADATALTAETTRATAAEAAKADAAAVLKGVPVAATVTASATLAPNAITPVDATAGAVTMTLPVPASAGEVIAVEKIDATTTAVAITGTIRGVGATTISLVLAHEAVLLVSESTSSWRPIADHKTLAGLDTLYPRKSTSSADTGKAIDAFTGLPIPMGGGSVATLSDVALASLGDRQVLRYLSSTGKWQNKDPFTFDPRDFPQAGGVDPSGASDSWAAVNAAWSLATSSTSGGTVEMPFGTFLLSPASGGNGGLLVQTNKTARVKLKGQGASATTIRLSTTIPSLTATSGTEAAGSTIKFVTIEDLTVDANNVTNANRGIVTHWYFTGLNADQCTIRRVDVINAGGLVVGQGRRCIQIGTQRADVWDTTTQNFITNITVEDCNLGLTGGGSNTGVLIFGFNNTPIVNRDYFGKTVTAANTLVDRITLRNIRWVGTAVPTFSCTSSGLQVGGDGLLGRVLIDNCYLVGSGDVGIELDCPLDAVVRDTYISNCVNEGSLIAGNHGGIPNPQQQRVRFINVVYEAAASTNFGAGFMVQGVHGPGTRFGDIIYQNCHYRRTAPSMLNLTSTAFIVPSAGFYFNGDWRRIALVNCSWVFDQMNVVATANTLALTPVGINVFHEGGVGALEIDGFYAEMNGTIDQGATFTGGNIQGTALQIDHCSKLQLSVNRIRTRTQLTRLGTAQVMQGRLREVQLPPTGARNISDNFTFQAASTFSKDYVFDPGSNTDTSWTWTSGQPLVPNANLTTATLWVAPVLTAASSVQNQINKVQDGAALTAGAIPSAGLANWRMFARLKVSDDRLSELRATVDSPDGTNLQMRVEMFVAGTPTTLVANTTLGAAPAAATQVSVRLKQQGDVLTADWFAASANPTLATAGTTTLSYTLTTGAQAQTFGAQSRPGYIGGGIIPADASGTLIRFRHDRMFVMSGEINGLKPQGDEPATSSTNGVLIGCDSTVFRVDGGGKIRCRDWDRRPALRNGGTDFSFPTDTALGSVKGMFAGSDSTLASPVAPGTQALTTGAVGGAGNWSYQNLDQVREEIIVNNGTGTLTTPFAEISTDYGITWTQAMFSATETLRAILAPGDIVRLTGSTIPSNVRKRPLY